MDVIRVRMMMGGRCVDSCVMYLLVFMCCLLLGGIPRGFKIQV